MLTGRKDARTAADVVARQCLKAVGEDTEIEGIALTVGMSIGIAVHTGPAVARSWLIAQADIAANDATI